MPETLNTSPDEIEPKENIIANPEAKIKEEQSHLETPEAEDDILNWYQRAFEQKFPKESQEHREKIKQLLSELEGIFALYEKNLEQELQKKIGDKMWEIKDEFNRDGFCLAWQEKDFNEYRELFQKTLDENLIFSHYNNDPCNPDILLKARNEYIENCQTLSQCMFVHNTHNFYLQQFIESGFMSNTSGSVREYGERTSKGTRKEDNPGNLAIFFQTLNPNIIKEGEGWFSYSFPIEKEKLPEKLQRKNPAGATDLCGICFDVENISENMYGEGNPCLTFGENGVEWEMRVRRKENDLVERALAVSSDFTAHRQFEPDIPTYIDLTQTPDHKFPSVIYASESERKKLLDSAKEAGWGLDESGNFSQSLFDEFVEHNFVFYSRDLNAHPYGDGRINSQIRQEYHKIVGQVAEKIKKYHGGFKKGLYLSYGNGKGFHSSKNVSFIKTEVPDDMDKFEWVVLE